jgi:catechol 2,3-dioxygenase-like lactoylglutathione lyase family enzyme
MDPAEMSIEFLDHVQVVAPPGCEREARQFYGRLLGLAEIEKPDGLGPGVWFQVGTAELHVGVAEDFTPAHKAHPALRVGSLAELERLALLIEEAADPVRWDDRIPGRQRFFTTDPWGNRLELLTG